MAYDGQFYWGGGFLNRNGSIQR